MSIRFIFSKDLTVSQFCDKFQISPATFYRLRKAGKVETYKVGASTRVKKESAEAIRSGGEL